MVGHVAKVSKERRAELADDYARRTDRLLAPKDSKHVKLIIRVTVQTIVQFGGIAMWG